MLRRRPISKSRQARAVAALPFVLAFVLILADQGGLVERRPDPVRPLVVALDAGTHAWERAAVAIGLGPSIGERDTAGSEDEAAGERDQCQAELRGCHRLVEDALGFDTSEWEEDWTRLAARVIEWEPGNWPRTVLVDRGSEEGVSSGLGVASRGAAVGRVDQVWPHHSRVRLVSDPGARVPAQLSESGVRGVVQGDGAGGCLLRFARWEGTLVAGTGVVTSSADRLFPAGLALGTVLRSEQGDGLQSDVLVRPRTSLFNLESVVILLPGAAPAQERG